MKIYKTSLTEVMKKNFSNRITNKQNILDDAIQNFKVILLLHLNKLTYIFI